MSLTSQLMRGMLLSALVTGPVMAQPGADADPVEALAAQGLECFQARDFSCAIEKYRQAYAIEPVAALLYNIAFIYDKKFDDSLDNLRLARDYYFRYAKSPDPDPETKIAALERILELEAEIREKEKALGGNQGGNNTGNPGNDTGNPGGSKKPVQPTTPVAGWVLLGTGVVLAGVGGTFGFLASQAADTQSTTTDPDEWNDLRDSGPTQALIGDIGMAVGGAAAITGLILILTHDDGTSPTETESDVKVAPAAGLGGFGLTIGGSF